MQKLLEVEMDKISVSKRGSVTAPIYFRFGNLYFPEEGWSDFPLTILSWWLREIATEREQSEFLFMDGHFEIKALRTGSDFQLRGVRRREVGDEVIFSELVSIDILLSSIKTEAAALLSHLKDICPENPDYRELLARVS